MNIIGTNLKKILFERNEFDKPVKLGKITNNIQITGVREKEFPPGKSLTFEFKFNTNYGLESPKNKSFGEIEIIGEVVALAPDKERKDVLKGWKKKQIEPKVMELILNVALELSQIEAMGSAKKVMLPLPIRLPRFKLSNKGQGA